MLADGIRKASMRYDRKTIQITSAAAMDLIHPTAHSRKLCGG
jgi:hypothetical protein